MYVLCVEFDLYTEFNKNYLYRFLSCIYILDFLGLCSLFSILFYCYPLKQTSGHSVREGLGSPSTMHCNADKSRSSQI